MTRVATASCACARCEELEEEVAYLRSELGLQQDAEAFQELRKAFLATPCNHGRSQAARFTLALYRIGTRAATRLQLMEATHRDHGEDERGDQVIDVWVCFARKALGKDAIETVWGVGYRLTEIGRERVAAIIGAPTAGPAIASLHRLDDLESLPNTSATGRVG